MAHVNLTVLETQLKNITCLKSSGQQNHFVRLEKQFPKVGLAWLIG